MPMKLIQFFQTFSQINKMDSKKNIYFKNRNYLSIKFKSNFKWISLIFLLLFWVNAVSQNIESIFDKPRYYSDKIYLKLLNSSSVDLLSYFTNQNSVPDSLQTIFSTHGVSTIEKPFVDVNTTIFDRTYQITITDSNHIEEFINELNNLGFIDFAEKIPISYLVSQSNDPIQPYHLQKINANTGSTIFSSIPGAPNNTIVAVIDDAVVTNHADLQANISANNWDVAGSDKAAGPQPDSARGPAATAPLRRGPDGGRIQQRWLTRARGDGPSDGRSGPAYEPIWRPGALEGS